MKAMAEVGTQQRLCVNKGQATVLGTKISG